MNASNRRSLWATLAALICILLIGALLVSAQSTPPSIPIGENQSSSLTNASSTSLFSVTVTTPQNINVLILATSPGFAPAFRVVDPNNAVIFDAANEMAQNIVQNQVTLASPGIYIIEIRSANNGVGQFTISIQPGAPFIPPIPLELEQPVTATVDPQNTQKVYSFTALDDRRPLRGGEQHLANFRPGDPLGQCRRQRSDRQHVWSRQRALDPRSLSDADRHDPLFARSDAQRLDVSRKRSRFVCGRNTARPALAAGREPLRGTRLLKQTGTIPMEPAPVNSPQPAAPPSTFAASLLPC